MSLVIGLESPVGANENLLELEEGKLALATSTYDAGTRVVVVARSDSDWTEIRKLVEGSSAGLVDGFLFTALEGSKSAMTATKTAMNAMKLSKAGWTMTARPRADGDRTLHVGFLGVSVTSIPLPLEVPSASRVGFLRGQDIDGADFVSSFEDDLEELARRALSPSARLVRWVIDRGMTLGYEVRDPLNRRALVLVGAFETTDRMLDDAGVEQVFRGPDAGRVLQQG